MSERNRISVRAIDVNLVSNVLAGIVLAVGLCFLFAYLVVTSLRITYPFDLEWLEGCMVDQVRWILSGNKLYVAPTLDFIPENYTPLYFYASAALSSAVGCGYLPLRLLSFVASLGTMFLVFLFVRRETGSLYYGIVAGCLFAAAYRAGGAWLDLARVDSLFVFLLFSALYVLRFYHSAVGLCLASVLVTVAFQTKQSAMILFIPMLIYAAVATGRRAVWFGVGLILFCGGSTLILDHFHDGWYRFYVFKLPFADPMIRNQLVLYWAHDLAGKMAIALALWAWSLAARALAMEWDKLTFYGIVGGGILLLSWSGRLHYGGYDNVVLPAYAFLAISGAIAVHLLLALTGRLPSQGMIAVVLAGMLATTQFAQLTYIPSAQVPTAQDIKAGNQLVALIAQIDGDVLIPRHGYLTALAGKRGYAHWSPITNILRSGGEPTSSLLRQEISGAIDKKRFAAVILDDLNWIPCEAKNQDLLSWMACQVERGYGKPDILFNDPFVLFPRTGVKTRPMYIYYRSNDRY